MKVVLVTVALATSVLAFNPAFAHGADPQHGGVVASANDLSFELVSQGEKAALYVVDHDMPADASKMDGKLTVLNGGEKSETELKAAGGNKLETVKPVKLIRGSKAVAVLTNANGKTTTVRFSFK